MVLSDRTIRAEIEAGRIAFDPYDPGLIQPSSVDVRVDRSFRVFHNARHPYIDVRREQPDLTELVTVPEDEPFILHPGEFVLGQTLERVRLPDDVVARLEGKALTIDTEVPTPGGWTTMGEIEVGDEVFAPDGDPVPVVAVTEVMADRRCFEVEFSDGTTVVADAQHQWEVQTKYDQRCGERHRVVTTEKLAERFKDAGGEYIHRVPRAEPVRYPKRELPIDPYVLGVWLGDGTSTAAEVTSIDLPILAQVFRAGEWVARASGPITYRVGGTGSTRDETTGRYVANDSLSSRLRALGLLGNKHIPREYLEASIEQRQALLEGLMDTDGYVDKVCRCDLTTVRRNLADDYRELVASLGHRVVVAEKRAMLYGRDCGPKYEVTFTPHAPVFRLPRKLARQRLTERRPWHRGCRSVRRVTPVAPVPVRCIEVGSRRGAFLITRSFLTTHNSSLGRLGLLIHSTAGFVDAGFEGNLTLELSNVANLPITIYHGMPIGQMSFMRMDAPVEHAYGSDEPGSKYPGQGEPTASRYFLNFPDSMGDA
jgi:deoxycytidine triphosphate deaminase